MGRETIYQVPKDKDYSQSRVAFFRFEGPKQYPSHNYIQVPDPGYDASYWLYQQLLQRGIFKGVVPVLGEEGIPFTQKIKIAREQGCDLMITGTVLYYFEGSPFLNSRVDEEIRVFDVETNDSIMISESTELGIPKPYRDYFVVLIEGKPAPPASALLLAHAKKFSEMLSHLTR